MRFLLGGVVGFVFGTASVGARNGKRQVKVGNPSRSGMVSLAVGMLTLTQLHGWNTEEQEHGHDATEHI